MIRCLLLYGVLFSGPAAVAQKQQLRFERIGTAQGLSHSNATCILQDNRGFMWFGTPDGLNRYDGYEFSVYRNDPKVPVSLSDGHIKSIFKDPEGTIWIGTSEGGLNRLDREKDRFRNYRNDPQDPASISDNSISGITGDSHGDLWVGTRFGGLNRLNKKTGRFTRYKYQSGDNSSISDSIVTVILEDSRHRLWVGTEKGGLNLLDPKSGRFIRFQHSDKEGGSLSNNDVTCLYEDAWHRLWIGTRGGGLDLLNYPDNHFRHFRNDPENPNSLPRNIILSMAGDDKDHLWIGTENGGLSILNLKEETFVNYLHDDLDNTTLSNNSIYSIYKDPQNNMWLGTFSGGVNFFNKDANQFAAYRHNSSVNSPGNNNILGFLEDGHGNIWIGTDGGGVDMFDPRKETFTHFTHQPGNLHSICGNYISAVSTDNKNNIWMGSCADGTTLFDPVKKTYRIVLKGQAKNGISGNNIAALMLDKDKDLWIASWDGGLDCLESQTGKYLSPGSFGAGIDNRGPWPVVCMLADSRGFIWFGTYDKGVDRYDKKTKTFTHFKHDSSGNSLSNNVVNSLCEDRKGNIWIGTKSGLNRFDPSSGHFTVYSTRDGLPDDHVLSILEDDKGNLWISTNQGLSRFDPITRAIANFTVADGLQSNEFKAHSCLKSSSGALYFGGVNGFNVFFPDSIRKDPSDPPLVLTHFQVFNKEVPIAGSGKDPSVLKEAIWETKTITLPYDQSVFSFEFASLNYTDKEKNQYGYMLEGFDKSWNNIGTKHTTTYTHLDPGKYVFKIRGMGNNGQWSSHITSVGLIITPPFWMTWWFRLLAAGGMITVAVIAYRFRVGIIKLQKKVLEQQVQERTERLALSVKEERLARMDAEKARGEAEHANSAKSVFLATMSHEIRTPMNGVLGMASLLAETPLTPEQQEYADTIRSCGEGLMNVINDILDFSKIESGKMELEKKSFDLRACVEGVMDLFSVKAGQTGLDLVYQIDDNVPPFIIGDTLRLRQVLMNLVGNAVKFTRQGEIFIGIRLLKTQMDGGLEIGFEVRDTGIGIPDAKIGRLFNAFAQVDSSTTRKYGGTGLGLVICEKLVTLMGGRIGVESQPGKGATFSFSVLVRSGTTTAKACLNKEIAGLEGKRILVVDDNATNRNILGAQLQQWKLSSTLADSGQAALDILSLDPGFDLILTDMQMPAMDGTQLALAVRKQYPGIPIILLNSVGHENNQCKQELFDSILTKPVRQHLLCEHILDALRRKGTGVDRKRPVKLKLAADLSRKYPLRILIAEDNVINMTLILHILDKLGYQPDAVENGQAALESVGRKQYDLILMDVQMPEIDGLEATRLIRRLPGRQPVIIALTANAMQGDREECLEAGMDDYLSKPVKQEELVAVLERWAPELSVANPDQVG